LPVLLCEGLAVFLALGNLAFANKFLGGKFFRYGLSTAKFLLDRAAEGTGPLDEVSPKVRERREGEKGREGERGKCIIMEMIGNYECVHLCKYYWNLCYYCVY